LVRDSVSSIGWPSQTPTTRAVWGPP
jgi:hypothetical protein